MSGMETPPRTVQPVSMDSLENPRTPLAAEPNKAAESQPNIQDGLLMPSDAPSSSQDIGGMMKIVPSELDVSFTCVTVGMIFQPELICLGFCFFLCSSFTLLLNLSTSYFVPQFTWCVSLIMHVEPLRSNFTMPLSFLRLTISLSISVLSSLCTL